VATHDKTKCPAAPFEMRCGEVMVFLKDLSSISGVNVRVTPENKQFGEVINYHYTFSSEAEKNGWIAQNHQRTSIRGIWSTAIWPNLSKEYQKIGSYNPDQTKVEFTYSIASDTTKNKSSRFYADCEGLQPANGNADLGFCDWRSDREDDVTLESCQKKTLCIRQINCSARSLLDLETSRNNYERTIVCDADKEGRCPGIAECLSSEIATRGEK
jgi:hypothetical protein